MTLAIACPSPSVYSETFIHMQLECLPCVLRVHGVPVASETVPGGPIHPLKNIRGILETAIDCGLRGRRWEGPQERELARRLRRSATNVLLANYGPVGVALLPVCRKLSLPLVVHFHGYDAHQRDICALHAESYRTLGREASAVIAVSKGMVESLVLAGIPESKIHLLRYGVDPGRFPQFSSGKSVAPRFFSVGRFVDKKAPYLTLLAFSQALKHLPTAKLVMAGSGALLETTRNLAIALQLGEAVEFLGVLSPEEVALQMRKATTFVQHSVEPSCGPCWGDREGTPVAVLEAMMAGLPIVATQHAGIGEVVMHQRSGLLCHERDVAGMAAHMVTLGSNPELASRYGIAGREEALARYTAEHYISELHSIIDSVTK